jgi:salicylate hydroxylase
MDDGAGVDVMCTDGRSFRGTAAVAADGLHSRTRALFSDDEAIGSGYVAYRGAVPMDQVSRHADLRDVVAWVGPGLHLVQYPLRSGRFYNQVAVFRSQAFARGEPDWGNPAELDERFAQCCEHVRESTPLLGRDNRWPMYDRAPIPTWVKGRIGLLGDAAHPMLQYLAQGACMATEDAVVLADKVAAKPSDLPSAFHDYQQQRYLRTGRVQIMARVYGEFYHSRGVEAELRNMMLKGRSPEQSYEGIAWLYGGI